MAEQDGARKRRLELDALLQDTALELVIGGEIYRLTDIPVALAIRAQERSQEGKQDQEADWQFVKDVLVPTCPNEASKQILLQALDNMGMRARHAITMSILDFFEPSDLIERLPLSGRLRTVLQIGLGQSETTSTPTTYPETTTE